VLEPGQARADLDGLGQQSRLRIESTPGEAELYRSDVSLVCRAGADGQTEPAAPGNDGVLAYVRDLTGFEAEITGPMVAFPESQEETIAGEVEQVVGYIRW
jgi:hypothetical protein